MSAYDPRSLRDAFRGQVLRGSGGVRYHVGACIGEGRQGWVFKSNWDEPDGMSVIVKVLRPDSIHEDTLRRFQREAEVLRMLSQQARPNPHIVRFFDHAVANITAPSGEIFALPYTVLEYVEGPTLEHALTRARTSAQGFKPENVRRLTRHVVLALEAVHAKKIVHRDLKPSNILLAQVDGVEVAKVTDFGLVKLVDVNLDRTTELAGASLGYAPPEQYEQGNNRVSPRSDVFSLAAIVYEMLTGKMAFPYRDGENPLVIVNRLLNGPRPTLAKSRDALAPEIASQLDVIGTLDAVLGRSLASDPAMRPETTTEFWSAVEPALRAAIDRKAAKADPFLATEPATGAPMRAAPSSLPPRPGSARMRVAEPAAANPAAWAWSIATRAIQAGMIRAAAFRATAISSWPWGRTGSFDWNAEAGSRFPHRRAVDLRAVRSIAVLREGESVLMGEHGLVMRVAANGAHEVWQVPDPEVTFLGALVEPGPFVTLVGERPARPSAAPRPAPRNTVGVVAQIKSGKLTLLVDAPSCTRLRAVTRMHGGTLIACGDWGALVRLELGIVEHAGTVCGGHLHALAPLGEGAVTVGAGGHALSLSARLDAQLEAVQTTRDLLALTISEDGAAWAGSAQARLLRRSATGWVRMSGDLGISPNVVAVWAGSAFVRAVCDDGTVIEGKLS